MIRAVPAMAMIMRRGSRMRAIDGRMFHGIMRDTMISYLPPLANIHYCLFSADFVGGGYTITSNTK